MDYAISHAPRFGRVGIVLHAERPAIKVFAVKKLDARGFWRRCFAAGDAQEGDGNGGDGSGLESGFHARNISTGLHRGHYNIWRQRWCHMPMLEGPRYDLIPVYGTTAR
jgi:hypothetical protein